MTNQERVLRVLRIAGRHGLPKLYAAIHFHIFEFGEVIRRLRKKGFNIETKLFKCKDGFYTKYVLTGES